ncbi:peptidase C39 family protein [Micromonospora sp. C81]|uniref:peptidase C39 family protein n=1 Tax=Micromonospora sp. C81 TaxID=2824881 RepID=UPI001B369852|nr:peptidase C39 family protein [Micromonospora sp. C81]MBQ1036731.1 peptidase C39 family protein [Micromonospora sp. C81]
MTIAAPPTGRDIAYRGFHLPADTTAGNGDGLLATGRGLALDGVNQQATWTSPPVRVDFPVSEVVPSWTADTPAGCWIEVELRGWHDDAPSTGWYRLARWAADDLAVERTSVPGQRDGDARVDTDTLIVTGATVTGWQARVTLCRPAESPTGPVLRSVGAVATGPTGTDQGYAQPASSATWGQVLDVPRYSQRLHAGQYPQWGGGGDSWCSPTCTSMVLAHWGAEPTPEHYAWVEPPGPRPVVVHAARHCYDHAYAGAGNWSFNTAYAGRYGMDAFVTRLRSLVEAEAFIAAGIPLIVSAAFRADEVPGLGYDTAGHLMVLVGFTVDGDPVLNDPYAPDDDAVRRTVPRQRFEAVWQRGSGGVAYVLRPPSVPLPPPPAQANW